MSTVIAGKVNSLGYEISDRQYLARSASLAEFDTRAKQVKNVSDSTVAAYRAYTAYLDGINAGNEGRSIKGFKAWTAAGRPTVEQYIAAHPRQAANRGLVKPKAKVAGKGKAKRTAAKRGGGLRAAMLQAATLLKEAATA